MLPKLADYFGISIDELLGYKINALTYKEQFVRFMIGNGILQLGEFNLKNGQKKGYYLNSEKLTTNAQVAKIGEYFADCIRENNIEFDVVVGLTLCERLDPLKEVADIDVAAVIVIYKQ